MQRDGKQRKKNNNTPLPKRGVYLRFENSNASPVVPRDPVQVFMPLTLSVTSVELAAVFFPPYSPLHFCNSCGFTIRFSFP